MSGIINPKTIIENAYTEIADEESERYFLKYFIALPIIMGLIVTTFTQINQSNLSLLGTIFSILAGFSITTVFSLVRPLAAHTGSDEDIIQDFFRSLRLYTSYSVVLVVSLVSVIVLMRLFTVYWAIEVLFWSMSIQYFLFIFVIIRRLDTLVKEINY
ncbi:MAG: hypothetical protein ACI8Z7_000268 [Candidatus Nanohaloarchaea archaeon]|jgi:hypothetical protein